MVRVSQHPSSLVPLEGACAICSDCFNVNASISHLAKTRIASALVIGFGVLKPLGDARPRSIRTCRQSSGRVQLDGPFSPGNKAKKLEKP